MRCAVHFLTVKVGVNMYGCKFCGHLYKLTPFRQFAALRGLPAADTDPGKTSPP